MASGTTSNYQLSQWSASDQVRMADFNADNQKLDTALKALDSAVTAGPKIVTGSYVGSGTYGEAHPNTLTFPFPPKFVYLTPAEQQTYYTLNLFRGMETAIVYNSFLGNTYNSAAVHLTWEGNTLRWYCTTDERFQLNDSQTYHYLAIG